MTNNTGPRPIIDSADIPRNPSERGVELHTLPEDGAYTETAKDILDSSRHYNQKQLEGWIYPEKMGQLLSQIEADANDAQFVKVERDSTTNASRETALSFDALLLEQIDYAIADSDPQNKNPILKRWDTHMTRRNGLRDTIAVLLENTATRDHFIEAVRKRQSEIIIARDGVENESRLSPDRFQEIATKEGEIAVENTPVLLDISDAASAAKFVVTGEKQDARSERHPKRAKLFAPYTKPEGIYASSGADQYEVSQNQRERADYDRLVNEDTVGYSIQTLEGSLRQDTELKALLAKAGYETVTEETVTALRENEDLRYEVGEYFLQKLDTMVRLNPTDFGPRIEANRQKSGDYVALPGMPSTSSREYAAWLALTKVSGMFNYKAERESDGELYDDSGRVVGAQHRNAADQVLFSGPARFY